MNYRHAFHAGNFADLVKHAALCLILDRLKADAAPLMVVDTHAGAGVYDLSGIMARKSGEAEAGIRSLMRAAGAPKGFAGLKAAVTRFNPSPEVTLYPGSPLLIADRLRAGDDYVGAEMHPEDFAALAQALVKVRGPARAVQADGYDVARRWARQDPRRMFVLVDPPFERADDYERSAQLVADLLGRTAPVCVAIWTPLKDMETFDRFVRRLEALGAPLLIAEARLKPLDNPMRLNGCGLVFVHEPADLEADLQPVLQWTVQNAGEAGAEARLWRA